MAFFSRRGAAEETDPAPEASSTSGPWDLSDQPSLGKRIDLGALRVPIRKAMAMRLDNDRASGLPIGVTVAMAESNMQMQVFAAPKSLSLWDEIRPQLSGSVVATGGRVEEVHGRFGTELLGEVPVNTPGGSGLQPVRFVGVDGPRWLIRATIIGPAALGGTPLEILLDVLADVVVDRGSSARPPGELIALTAPGTPEPKADEPGGVDLSVLKRGPEMTETR